MSARIAPELWRRASEVLDRALERDPAERPDFVRDACRDEPEVRRLVEELLAADARAGSFLESAAPAGAAGLLEEIASDGAPESHAGDPPPETIGPWRLMRELGRGGMGVVYLAERASGDFRQVAALKLIRRELDSEEVQARFQRERRILASLQHPGIARLLDGGLAPDGRPWFAMEHVDGLPITRWCDERRAGVEQRLRLFLAACEAVQHAHQSLVIHRDLKPSNFLVTPAGEVKLLDFGIARLLPDPEERDVTAPTLTRAGLRAMTPDYAAPEQVRGEAATTATDVYGLGVVLYELLAGRRPYRVTGSGLDQIEQQILQVQPAPPSRAASGSAARRLAGDLDTIVMMALRKEPERRYPTVEALARDLRRHLDGLPVSARPDTLGYRVGKFVRRHRVGVAASALVLAALLAGLAGTLWQARAARISSARATEVKEFLASLFEVSDPSASRGDQVTARELLERGAARIERELAGQPEIQAEMMGLIGRLYGALGDFERAEPMLRRALALAGQAEGDRRALADLLDEMGSLLREMGRHEEAESLLRRALEMKEGLFGRESLEAAATLNSLGVLLRRAGRLDDSEAHYRRALAIRRAGLGPDHPDIATTLNDYAVLLYVKRSYDDAAARLQEALRIRRARLGETHPLTLESRTNLASLMRRKGDLAAVEAIHREALEAYRAIYGEEHPDVAVALNDLATDLQNRAAYAEAEPLFARALEMRRRLLGRDHPRTVSSAHNLGLVLYDLGRMPEAEALLLEALEKSMALYGTANNNTLAGMLAVSMVLRDRGSLEEADRRFDETMKAHVESRGGEDPETAYVMREQGLLRLLQGRLADSGRLLEAATRILARELGESHVDVARTRVGLGGLRREEGKLEDSASMLAGALATLRGALRPGHPYLSRAQLELGLTLLAQGRLPEAESSIRDALGRWEKAFGEASWQSAEARLALGMALARQGRQREAELLRESAGTILRNQLGGAHRLARQAGAPHPAEGGAR